MSFYQNDTQQHSRLTDAIKKYEDFITSNPQEEEVTIEHFPPTPTNLKKKYFFTDKKLSDTNTNMSASYSQVTSTTSLLATQILAIMESVAFKNSQEITAATTKVTQSTQATQKSAESCTTIQNDLHTLVSTTKSDFEDTLTKAKENIQKFEDMQKNAVTKMQQQEDNTNWLANIINSYQNQFNTLATRQEKIDKQLSTQNNSLIYLQDRIEDILTTYTAKTKE